MAFGLSALVFHETLRRDKYNQGELLSYEVQLQGCNSARKNGPKIETKKVEIRDLGKHSIQ